MTLAPVWRLGDLTLTEAPYLVAFGTSYGEPENATDILRSLLSDGDLEVTPRRGNRTVTLPILIEGSDLADLGAAEAALWAEVDRPRNELYCDPGDGFGAPFVFDVFRGAMVFNRDDEYEKAGYRSFTLTFKALPWPHADTETTIPALPASGSTTVNIDNGSSTTGWTGFYGTTSVTPSTSGGALTVESPTAVTGAKLMRAVRTTGTIDTSATKYLVVDWKYGAAGASLTYPNFYLDADGTTYYPLSSAPSPTAGYTRAAFYISAAAVSVLNFQVRTTAAAATTRSLTIDNIDRTDVAPGASTARQMSRIIDIDGSAPTTGSISVQHATSALGDVLLYTCPDDGSEYVPHNRASYRTGGATVSSDSAAVSGSSEPLSGTSTFDRPNASLPSGTYLVMIRAKRSSAATATITWTVKPRMNSTDLTAATTYTTSLAFTTSYQFFRLGVVTLPLMDTATTPSALTRITVTGTASETLDELYLFNITTGRLTQMSCGTGTPAAGSHSNRLWIDSPSLDNEGLGRYLRGYAADQSDAFSAYPFMESPGIHEFEPPRVKVFTVTTNPTTAADVAFTYKAAWHTHAAA